MAEPPDEYWHSLPENLILGEWGRNGQTGLTSGDPYRRTPVFAGYALFLAVAITGISGLYVGGGVEQAVLRRFAEQPAFDVARYRYAAGRPSDSDVPATASPDVAVLIEQHRAALAALSVAVPEAICR